LRNARARAGLFILIREHDHALQPEHGQTARDPRRGLCAIAKRVFEPGEIVLSSEPYEFVLFPAFKDERCHECFQRAEKLSRCAKCKRARYCSEKCQGRAWHAHHKFECVIADELESMCAQLPEVAQQELCLLLRVALKAMGPRAEDGSEYKPDYEDVRGMPSHEEAVRARDPDRSKGNVFLAQQALMLLCLPQLRKKKTLDWDRLPSVQELARMLASFACNDFSIWDELLVAHGAGVYPVGALLNHSCEPNCVLYYHAHTHRQSIRALRRIGAGELLSPYTLHPKSPPPPPLTPHSSPPTPHP